MNVTDLLPEIRREAAGCPDITLKYALVRAARRFCAESWFVRRTLVLATVAEQKVYTLAAPNSYEEVIAIKLAQISVAAGSTQPLTFVESESVTPDFVSGVPGVIGFLPYTSIWLSPPPKTSGWTVTLTGIVQPILGAEILGDELSRKWNQAIGAGALAWLQNMSKEPWFNERESVRNDALYRAGIANAKADAANNFVPGGQRIRPRGFIV